MIAHANQRVKLRASLIVYSNINRIQYDQIWAVFIVLEYV